MGDRVLLLDGTEAGVVVQDEWGELQQFSGGLTCTAKSSHGLSKVNMSRRSGNFLVSDNRGKVYSFSSSNNKYEVVKKATTAGSLTCMAHLDGKASMGVALFGYDKGSVLVYDTSAKRTIASIKTPTGAAPQFICCHPTKSMAIIADESNTLSVWDLRVMTATLALTLAQDTVVDVQFIENGAMVVVVLETSGIHVYRSSDMKVVLRCPFPDSERRPKWTSFAHVPSTLQGSLRFLLAGDNSLVYLWETETPFDIATDVAENSEEAPLIALLGVLDQPVNMQRIVAMTALGEPALQPQILLLGDDGSVNIVDAQGFGGGGQGIWTIIADLPPKLTRAATVASSACPLNKIAAGPNSSVFVLAGTDGACRIFDAAAALGSGSHIATLLPVRPPYPSSVRVPVYRVVDGRGQKVAVHKEQPSIAVRERKGISASEKLTEKLTEKKAREEQKRKDELKAKREAQRKNQEAQKKKQDEDKEKKAAANKENAKAEKRRLEQEQLKKYSNMDDLAELEPVAPDDRSDFSKANKAAPVHTLSVGLPLHELASTLPSDKLLTESKLKAYLAAHHEFPVRYRQVIWRYLLKLPENAAAFAELSLRGPHPAFETLHDKYPVRSRRLFSRLEGTCSQLAHWAPIFGEVSYLPQLVFPFIIVYGVDELATLETAMTILMWWGHSWHATYPQPPIHVVDAIDHMLKLADPKLHKFMSAHNAPPGLVGWGMVSSLFTEVLSRENWLRLMDHVFLSLNRSAILYMVPVALMMAVRATILHQTTGEDILAVGRRQHSVDFTHLNKILHTLQTTVPNKFLAGVAPRTRFDEHTGSGVADRWDLDDVEQARECLALNGGHPIFPLPSGRYPAYDGYPAYVVDWQLRDRKAAMDMGKETGVEEEDVLENLQSRLAKVNHTHLQWEAVRAEAVKLDESARKAALEKEKQQLRELQRIEEAIAAQRQASLSLAEQSAQQQMAALEAAKAETEALMRASEQQMLERAGLTLNLQRQREFAESAAGTMQEKINAMHLRRSKEEWVKAVEKSVEQKELELAARDRVLSEALRKQEEEAELRREDRRRRAEFLREEEGLARVHDEATGRLQKLMLSREADALELERQRALRIAKEQADEALEAAQRSKLLLQKQEAATLLEARAKSAVRDGEKSKQGYMDVLGMIRSDGERAAVEEREKVLLSRLGSDRPAAAVEAKQLEAESVQRLEKDVVQRVAAAGAAQERMLGRMMAPAPPAEKGYLSE
jgi:hypothetical protein